MYGTNPFSGIGIGGLFVVIIIWVLGTIVTGYLLGIGIWSAMPHEFKRLAKLELGARRVRTPEEERDFLRAQGIRHE